MIPLMAGSFVAVLHWPQLLALFGLGTAPAHFSIAWKSQPLPVVYIVTVLVAALLFELKNCAAACSHRKPVRTIGL
jgi:hypothetical protein